MFKRAASAVGCGWHGRGWQGRSQGRLARMREDLPKSYGYSKAVYVVEPGRIDTDKLRSRLP